MIRKFYEADHGYDNSGSSLPSGVFAVTINYGIKSHPTDLSNVMKPDEVLFIGTGYECACFIRDHKPSPPSGEKSVGEIEQWYYKWLSDRNKSGIVTENVLDMLKDFAASQQPVNDGWEEGYEGAHNFDEDELPEPPKQTP